MLVTDRTGTVIVTGGASGLGAAVADLVAKAGLTPVVLDVRAPSGEVAYELVDLSDTRAAEEAVHGVAEQHPDLVGLVTAAGIDRCGRFEDVPGRDWERVVSVNLLGTVAVVRAALPALRANSVAGSPAPGGRVVTVASTLGLRALSDATAYCASKFGVVGFTRALMAEESSRPDAVGVTLLLPGGMDTPFFDGRPDQYRPGPEAQLNRPEDVAEAVMFALMRPRGCEVREMLVCPTREGSWP